MDYKTMKKVLQEEPNAQMFNQYIPFVEVKRNKKNDSKIVLQV